MPSGSSWKEKINKWNGCIWTVISTIKWFPCNLTSFRLFIIDIAEFFLLPAFNQKWGTGQLCLTLVFMATPMSAILSPARYSWDGMKALADQLGVLLERFTMICWHFPPWSSSMSHSPPEQCSRHFLMICIVGFLCKECGNQRFVRQHYNLVVVEELESSSSVCISDRCWVWSLEKLRPPGLQGKSVWVPLPAPSQWLSFINLA